MGVEDCLEETGRKARSMSSTGEDGMPEAVQGEGGETQDSGRDRKSASADLVMVPLGHGGGLRFEGVVFGHGAVLAFCQVGVCVGDRKRP
ncbi:hypothetical protein [Nocardia sp. NPDC050710]|uniref:hypothetical protein n=1 Tax=Nocardia sp. NPDC050710 TaxID=3157220 RepID=UPI0033D085C0